MLEIETILQYNKNEMPRAIISLQSIQRKYSDEIRDLIDFIYWQIFNMYFDLLGLSLKLIGRIGTSLICVDFF